MTLCCNGQSLFKLLSNKTVEYQLGEQMNNKINLSGDLDFISEFNMIGHCTHNLAGASLNKKMFIYKYLKRIDYRIKCRNCSQLLLNKPINSVGHVLVSSNRQRPENYVTAIANLAINLIIALMQLGIFHKNLRSKKFVGNFPPSTLLPQHPLLSTPKCEGIASCE